MTQSGTDSFKNRVNFGCSPSQAFFRGSRRQALALNHHLSAAFTAAPLPVVAAIWFVATGLCLILTCLCFCCCRGSDYGYSRTAYAISLILLSLFTIGASILCARLAGSRSHGRGKENYFCRKNRG